jgi:trimethylamine:corrinoid methyltransferase-like protein
VWNTTRANFTAAGSFGQIVSTSTAAPLFYVDGPFSTHSTDGLETLSSAGLETLSSAGLETLSSVGLETLSSAGLETLSSAGLETISSAVVKAAGSSAMEAINLDHIVAAVGTSDHVVDGSLWARLVSSSTFYGDYESTLASLNAIRTRGDAAWTTVSTEGLETLSSAGLETLSSAGLETLSSAGLETLSSAGLETAISSDVAAQVWNTTRANFTAAGSFGQVVSTSTGDPSIWANSAAGSPTSDIAAQVWNSTRANFTAAGSFGQVVSTSTGDPSIWANSAAGSPTSDIAAQVWNTTRSNFTAAGSFGQIVSTSTADPSIWANSAAGSPTSDIAAQVWNTTRANFTAAGSFGQIVSTSTAAPVFYVDGPFSTHSTDGLETLSSAGLETLSSAGLETLSSAGLETLSSAGLETLSSAGLETISSQLVADAAWDETLTGANHNIVNSAGRRLRQLERGLILHESTAFGDVATVNTVVLDAGADTNDDFYNHAKIVITEGTGAGQERIIVDYDGGTKTATIAPPWIVTPATTDVFEIETALSHAETGWATVKVGIVQTASQTTQVTLDSLGSTVDDYYNGDVLKIDFDNSTGAEGQSRIILDYDGTSKIAFLDTGFTQSPTTSAEYIIEDGLASLSTTLTFHDRGDLPIRPELHPVCR